MPSSDTAPPSGPDLVLIDYDAAWLDALVPMWRESSEFGLGLVDPHPLAEQRDYFLATVLPACTVRLAIEGTELLGFVAATAESVQQLHVRVGHHRRRIGRHMLDWAKAQSGGSLWLYTFARNRVARAFYEANGFTPAAFGIEPVSQLDDVRYQWTQPLGRDAADGLGDVGGRQVA